MKYPVSFTLLLCSYVAIISAIQVSPLWDITKGMTTTTCLDHSDCRGDRRCLSTNGRSDCRRLQSSDDVCVCTPRNHVSCVDDSPCARGERCARFQDTPFFCVAASLGAEGINTANPVLDVTCPGGGNGKGLTLDNCEKSSDCAGDRECLVVVGEFDLKPYDCCTKENSGACGCIPKEFVFCTGDKDCAKGETCVASRTDPPRCISKKGRIELDRKGQFYSRVM